MKIFLRISLFVCILSISFPLSIFAQSTSGTATIIPNPPIITWSTASEAQGTVEGTLDATAVKHFGGGFQLFVRYAKNDSGGIVDLTNRSDASTQLATVPAVNTSGTVDPTKAVKGGYPFSAILPSLSEGRYIYQVIISDPPMRFGGYNWSQATASYILTPQYFFDVLVSAIPDQYKLVGPVATGGNAVDVTTGYWADPEVRIAQALLGDYQIELGYARLASAGDTHYNCVLSGDTDKNLLGSKVTVSSSSSTVSIKNAGTFKKLAGGLYCAGLRYTPVGLSSITTPTQVKVNPPDGTYFVKTSTGATGIFSVGGSEVPKDATLDTTANGNGCSTGSDNTTYCLLAPLPGVGDATGKLNVSKGIGDYINTIIRLVFGLIGVLSVLMIVIGGIEYMSTVNIGEKEGAKDRITSALFGILLALASYLILKTINPKLVDLSVVVHTVNVATDEGDESGPVPSGLPSVTGVTLPTNTRATDLAAQILTSPNIVLYGLLGCNDSRSTALQTIKDTAAGQPAWTSTPASPNCPVTASQVPLDTRMLAGILAASSVSQIQVNATTGGLHSSNSLHYSGRAFDVQASASDTARNIRVMDACRAAGASEIIGPCSNNTSSKICVATGYTTNSGHQTHIHCGWR